MSDEKKSASKPYDNRVGGGRVADPNKKTVHSPKQIDQMKKESDKKR